MKKGRSIATLLSVLILVISTLCLPFDLAYAETESIPVPEDPATETVVTNDYVEWGTLYALATDQELGVVVEGSAGWQLHTFGAYQSVLTLPDYITNPAELSLALRRGERDVLLLWHAEGLWAVDLLSQEWLSVRLPQALDLGLSVHALTCLGLHPTQDVLYAGYGNGYLVWAPLADTVGEGEPLAVEYFRDRAATIIADGNFGFDRFVVGEECVYFHNDTLDKSFTYDIETAYVSPSFDEQAEMFLPFAEGVLLREGAVWSTENADEAVISVGAEQDAELAACGALAMHTGGIPLLFAVDNGQAAIKVYDTDYQLVQMFGSRGNSLGRLSSPTALSVGQVVAVNDKGNQRVSIYDPAAKKYYLLDYVADELAVSGNHVYVAVGGLVHQYRIAQGQVQLICTFDLAVVEHVDALVAVCDEAYALAEGKLYCLHRQSGIDRPQVSEQVWESEDGNPFLNAVDLVAGRHADVLYLVTKDGQETYVTPYKEGISVGVSEQISSAYSHIEADYCGNLYVLSAQDGKLYTHVRNLNGYQVVEEEVDLIGLSFNTADGAVYGLRAHALLKLPLTVATEQNSQYDHPAMDEWRKPYQSILTTQAVWGYAACDNYESLVRVEEGKLGLLLAEHTYMGNDYYYVEIEIHPGERAVRIYLPKDQTQLMPSSTPTAEQWVRYNGADAVTGIYPYPSYEATATHNITTDRALFKIIRIVGVYEGQMVWPWYEIEYEGERGFVCADHYVTAEIQHPTVERFYARVVANRLGETIPVYVAPSTEAEVFTTLVDGTEIELVSPYDEDSEWTVIRLDDVEYYVLTANVTQSALTNGQTFAIILAGVVLLAAIVTFLMYKLVKR
ncbi:MAG: hypothetical protein IJX70_03590 [Clostridia bacterium]|nr:hypothetical protein [Clostridia bacterium]